LPQCVILFRLPHTDHVDGILDENEVQLTLFDSYQQAHDWVEHEKIYSDGIVYQIVELSSELSL
jgi:hypothetical protein